MPRRCPLSPRLLPALAGAALSHALLAPTARAEDHPVFLQWFETRWSTVEHKVPDFFMAGYDSAWFPPPFKAADPTSPGYDTFDRFDLGSPGAETAYGTEQSFRALVEEFHQASALVYVDLVLNHNSGRNNSDAFHNAGGYPGFALRVGGVGGDFWGDFHDGSKQSHDPNSPSNYDLFNGDLLSLIDIAQEKNYQFIRHPVTPGDPLNLPAGTVRNKVDPANRRFYPDRQLAPAVFTNTRLPAGQQQVTLYPYNTADPSQGDPVAENATGLLVRSVQWLLDVHHVDGFRLDAAKHIPQWFWDQYFDSAVYNRRRTFAGGLTTPFSFGEAVAGNDFITTYTRKNDGFGNRDALDINGAGQLRDLLTSRGPKSWNDVLLAHLDHEDNGGDTLNHFGNNGSLGVNHLFSHDNGSAGNGGSAAPLPGSDMYALPEWAYLLFRPGPPVVYYNSREFIDRFQFRGFWPREGNPTALGVVGSTLDSDLTNLVRLSNGYARGELRLLNYTDPQNTSRDDVLIFERKRAGNQANVLVGVNDSYLSGVALRSVQTSFPPGTRLRELTGNAASPLIDPSGEVADTLVVDANQRVLLAVPYNKNASGVTHHKGFVIYGPAAPSGTLQVLSAAGQPIASQLAPEPTTIPAYRRRITPVTVVTTPQFELRLTTTKTDPLDADWDDFAAFRIDAGYPSAGSASDFNGQNNGPDFAESDPYIPRFEAFVQSPGNAGPNFALPLATTPGATNGVYRHRIDSSSLGEGFHYIKAVAFRRRPSGTDPIFTEFRQVIYVDRTGPAVTLADAALPINTPIYTFRVLAADRTATGVWILVNPPTGADPLALINPSNAAGAYDRSEWRRTVSGLRSGANNITVVATEATGTTSVQTYAVNVTVGSGDLNTDGEVTIDDLYAIHTALTAPYNPVADVNASGAVDINDLRALESLLRPTELRNMAIPQR